MIANCFLFVEQNYALSLWQSLGFDHIIADCSMWWKIHDRLAVAQVICRLILADLTPIVVMQWRCVSSTKMHSWRSMAWSLGTCPHLWKPPAMPFSQNPLSMLVSFRLRRCLVAYLQDWNISLRLEMGISKTKTPLNSSPILLMEGRCLKGSQPGG